MRFDDAKKLNTDTHVLQLQRSGGVVRLHVFRQQRDEKARVPEGHLALLGHGPVLSALFLTGKEERRAKR